jgi:hypothetical protein
VDEGDLGFRKPLLIGERWQMFGCWALPVMGSMSRCCKIGAQIEKRFVGLNGPYESEAALRVSMGLVLTNVQLAWR